MKLRNAILSISLPALLVAGTAFALQDDHGGMEMPQPTKEHAMLQKRVGTWDCVVSCEMMGEPTKATETVEAFGGFWIVADFEGSFMGMPYQGKSLATYDPAKEKFVTTWCDTTSPNMMIMEGTAEAGGRKITSTGLQDAPPWRDCQAAANQTCSLSRAALAPTPESSARG
jgi:hypothetical protein